MVGAQPTIDYVLVQRIKDSHGADSQACEQLFNKFNNLVKKCYGAYIKALEQTPVSSVHYMTTDEFTGFAYDTMMRAIMALNEKKSKRVTPPDKWGFYVQYWHYLTTYVGLEVGHQIRVGKLEHPTCTVENLSDKESDLGTVAESNRLRSQQIFWDAINYTTIHKYDQTQKKIWELRKKQCSLSTIQKEMHISAPSLSKQLKVMYQLLRDTIQKFAAEQGVDLDESIVGSIAFC